MDRYYAPYFLAGYSILLEIMTAESVDAYLLVQLVSFLVLWEIKRLSFEESPPVCVAYFMRQPVVPRQNSKTESHNEGGDKT